VTTEDTKASVCLVQSFDLKTSRGVVGYLKTSKNKTDWTNKCDQIKKANGGDYPSFWFKDVIESRIPESLGLSSKLEVISITVEEIQKLQKGFPAGTKCVGCHSTGVSLSHSKKGRPVCSSCLQMDYAEFL